MSDSLAKQTPVRVTPPAASRAGSIRLTRFVQHTLIYIVLAAASVAFLFPLLWMASTSLKEQDKVMQTPPQLIPVPPNTVVPGE